MEGGIHPVCGLSCAAKLQAAPDSIEMCDVSTQLFKTCDSESYTSCFSIVRKGPRPLSMGRRIRNVEIRVVTKRNLLVCFNPKAKC